MKLFTEVINGLEVVTHKVHKENASIFSIEIIATCLIASYYYPGVAPITKKNKHTYTKSWYTEKMTVQNLMK